MDIVEDSKNYWIFQHAYLKEALCECDKYNNFISGPICLNEKIHLIEL